jgi:predicted kinase
MNFRKWLESQRGPLRVRNNKILILMRGLPGSGKSFTSKQLLYRYGGGEENGHIFSIDHEFMPNTIRKREAGINVSDEEEDAEYKKNFSTSRLPVMVRKVIERFKKSVDQGITPLIVDNTNIKTEHMRSFADYAEKAGYEVKIQYPESEHWKQHKDALRTKDSDAMKAFASTLRKMGRHDVPEERLIQMMKSWDYAPTMIDILGRDPTPRNKIRESSGEIEDFVLRRPKCEHPGCDKNATGICSTLVHPRIFHRRWACDQHITGSNWIPIQDTNWWEMYTKLTGKEPE